MKCYDLDSVDAVVVVDFTTVLAKLQEILDCCADIDANTDGIEALITTTNSLLTSIDGNTDGLEGLLITIDAVLDAIKIDTGNIDTNIADIETLLIAQQVTLDAMLSELEDIRTHGDNTSTTTVNASATDVLIKASQIRRVELIIVNRGTSQLWLMFGGTAVVNTGIPIPRGGIWIEDKFTGEVRGIWEGSPTGNAQVIQVRV